MRSRRANFYRGRYTLIRGSVAAQCRDPEELLGAAMKSLLVVDVNPRLEFSVSRNLTSRFVGGAFTPRKRHSSANRSPFKRAEFGSPIRMVVSALFIAAGIATASPVFAGTERGSQNR